MFISVVIITHNRKSYLHDLVLSVCNQTFLGESFEVIVVDNASQDGTAEEIERLKTIIDHPIIYVLETKHGASNARNAGAWVAKGDIVAFLDDDVIVPIDWLSCLAKGYELFPQAVCISGRTELYWETPRPEWVPLEVEGLLGSNKFLGDSPRLLLKNEPIFEFNLAIQKSAMISVGGFDPRLGPKGNTLNLMEGKRLVNLLRKYGQIVYFPGTIVYHRVPAVRVSKRYLLWRGYIQGQCNERFRQIEEKRSKTRVLRSIITDSSFFFRDLLSIPFLYIRDSKQAFGRSVFALSWIGQIQKEIVFIFSNGVGA